jgi:GTP pyrophosphokinase
MNIEERVVNMQINMGDRILRRRNQLNMTRAMLSEVLNTPEETVRAWETNETLPETEMLPKISIALNTSVSYLMGESAPREVRWKLKERLFSEDAMFTFIRNACTRLGMDQAVESLHFMQKSHSGQFRKGTQHVPYINHPLLMACQAFALHIATDDLISAILLHDVVEDCGVSPEELPVNEETRHVVELLTFKILPGLTRRESKKIYFDRIAENRTATMVKVLDRCNNISGMATCFTSHRMADYIDETEKYVMPLLDKLKYTYTEYNDVSFLLKYHMKSVLETIKFMLSENK